MDKKIKKLQSIFLYGVFGIYIIIVLIATMIENSRTLVLFIPLGIYLQLFRNQKRIRSNVLIVFGVGLAIEVIRYLFKVETSNVNEVIQNMLGGVIGIIMYQGIFIVTKDRDKIRRIVTFCSSIVGIPTFLLTILLLVNS